MKNHTHILKWATDFLVFKGFPLQHPPEIVQETPWSNVVRFSTLKEDFYLKQTPPSLFLESKIIQLLNQLHASVASVISINDDLYCFLMKDAGLSLRKYLKVEFQLDLLCQAIKQFTTIQRITENHVESFLSLSVPDWRLNNFPNLYDQLIQQTEFLKENGITEKELHILQDLSPKVSEQCELLSQYRIPETLVQPDFNTNNILFDSKTQRMTLIDLGEIVIAHPFFSLLNFLYQATIHHGIKELDQNYCKLQNACYENWLELATKNQLLEVFTLVKKLWPIYSAMAAYRLMTSLDPQSLKDFYANRANQLARHLREYVAMK